MREKLSFGRVAITAAMVLGSLVLMSPGAEASSPAPTGRVKPADTTLGKFTVKYDKHWTFKSSKLKVCVKFTASGKFTYKVTETITTHAGVDHWINQTLRAPQLNVQVFNSSCKSHHPIKSYEILQHWTGYACSFNPRLSISASATGVSVSVSGWPSCGDRTQGIYKSMYHGNWHHTQFNSGSPLGFGQYNDLVSAVGLVNPPPCYGLYPSAQLTAGANSDSFGLGNIHKAAKVCLNKT